MQNREHSLIVTAKVRASDELWVLLERSSGQLQFQDDPKVRLIAGCLDLVIEHHISIVFLVNSHRIASAFALIRVQYEALIRSLWMKYCAPDFVAEDASKICSKTLDMMVRDISASKNADLRNIVGKSLAKFQVNVIGRMNDYVHSGYSAISSRSTNDFVEANYADEEIIEALKFADFFAIAAAISLAGLAENDEVSRYFQTLSTTPIFRTLSS
jgi:hypothetical protein